MKSIAIIALVILLPGCAPTIAGANERGGTIQRVGELNKARAFKEADAHCHQYGRVARISYYDVWSNSLDFDCVEK